MKEMRTVPLGLTFAGCFLGAGYVSGQELWQFFGSFGAVGYIGLLLAVFLIGVFGFLLVRLAQITGLEEMDRLVVHADLPWLRASLSVLECTFLFGVMVVMSAGASALFHQLWSIPRWLGSLLFGFVLILVALWGIQGLIRAFSVLVPILVCVTVGVSILAWLRCPVATAAPAAQAGANPLLRWWPTSAIVFFAYNVFGSFGILSPIGVHIPDRKTARRGILLGCALLLTIALSVLHALGGYPQAAQAELPMLAVAEFLSPVLAVVHGSLLLLAMFGSALSCLVAVQTFLGQKFVWLRVRRKRCTVALAGLALLGSQAGFGTLIGILYPLFGYLSLFFLVLLALHCREVRRGRAQRGELLSSGNPLSGAALKKTEQTENTRP